MKKRLIISALVILVAVAASLGATMAWFTAESDPIDNVFTAGTVDISAGEDVSWGEQGDERENWNPGDCDWKFFTITNEGTKGIYLRAKFTAKWEDVSGDILDKDGNVVPNWWDHLNVSVVSTTGSPADTVYGDAPEWNFIAYDPVAGDNTGTYNEGEWFIDTTTGEEEWFTAYYYLPVDLDGTNDEPDVENRQAYLYLKICLDGPNTRNAYQGAKFILSGSFEAIQRSHEAAFDEWGAGIVGGEWVKVSYNEADGQYQTEDDSHYWDMDDKEWKAI